MSFERGDRACHRHHSRVIRCFNIGTSCCTPFNHQYQHESWMPPALYGCLPPTGVSLLSLPYSSVCALWSHFFDYHNTILVFEWVWNIEFRSFLFKLLICALTFITFLATQLSLFCQNVIVLIYSTATKTFQWSTAKADEKLRDSQSDYNSFCGGHGCVYQIWWQFN